MGAAQGGFEDLNLAGAHGGRIRLLLAYPDVQQRLEDGGSGQCGDGEHNEEHGGALLSDHGVNIVGLIESVLNCRQKVQCLASQWVRRRSRGTSATHAFPAWARSFPLIFP